MKRKLISLDAFQKVESRSLSNAAHELIEAEYLVADLLGYDEVTLHCYDQEDVYY